MSAQEGSSFLKKRTKKLLSFWRVRVGSVRFPQAPISKSFLLLFFKKEVLFPNAFTFSI
jgi:hypothetical protein